jgi:hypothetical protein
MAERVLRSEKLRPSLRLAVLLAVTAAGAIVVLRLPPIPQDPAYHRFADDRTLLGIPSFQNVASNLPFAVVGLLGLTRLRRRRDAEVRAEEVGAWFLLFLGVTLTAFGSAYYHLAPSNARLVWDRLPMSFGFMGLLAGLIGERVSQRLYRLLLWPLAGVGAASVLYWYATEIRGQGDLRPYVLVQFLPLVLIPLILALYRPLYTQGRYVVFALLWYAAAKVFELYDRQIFETLGFVNGHSLKHLAAAAGCGMLVSMFNSRESSTSKGFGHEEGT